MEAVDELLEIIRRDRAWNDDAARKRQLLTIFEAAGPGVSDVAASPAGASFHSLLFS